MKELAAELPVGCGQTLADAPLQVDRVYSETLWEARGVEAAIPTKCSRLNDCRCNSGSGC